MSAADRNVAEGPAAAIRSNFEMPTTKNIAERLALTAIIRLLA
jgi:hypothetical protein